MRLYTSNRNYLVLFLALFSWWRWVWSEPAIEIMSNCDDSINACDRAKLTFYPSTGNPTYDVYFTNEDCYKCSKTYIGTISSTMTKNICVNIWTPFPYKIFLMNHDSDHQIEEKHYTFEEKADYDVNVENSSINIVRTKDPYPTYEPLYVLLGVLAFVILCSFAIPLLKDKYEDRKSFYTNGGSDNTNSTYNFSLYTNNETSPPLLPPSSASNTPASKKPARLRSLDTFRGLSLCLMIFVNYGGGGYYFFEHAAWNGLTLADLVFPWFMWIMGVSMALSFSNILPPLPADSPPSSIYTSKPYLDVLKRVCIRSVKLFLLGMFLANGYDYTTWRIPGVLQYFALSYFLVSLTVLIPFPYTQLLLQSMLTKHRSTSYDANTKYGNIEGIEEEDDHMMDGDGNMTEKKRGTLSKILSYFYVDASLLRAYRYEYCIQACIFFLYFTIALAAAMPGCPRGYNGPGGVSNHSDHPECTGGIHKYIDLMLFTHKMIYHSPTCKDLYSCEIYDPEGFLGGLTATNLTYLGLITGRILLHYPNYKVNIKIMAYQASILLLLCGLLCGFSKNEGWIPINKNLWSASFICVCGGFGIVGLILCYVLIDVYKFWTGAPLVYLGMNSILIYCAHGILQGYFPFAFIIFDNTHALHLASNVLGVTSWIFIAYYFHKIKFFVKV